jgi:hypothetical protein
MNPTPLQFHGLIKIHKTNMPIRPVINWKQAPANKLAQHLANFLTTYIPLPNALNIIKLYAPTELPYLAEVPYNSHLRLASLDVNNMYANIPTDELIPHITALCNWHNTCKEMDKRS